MATTTVNVRMDENLKKDFERLCNELGLNMSTAMNIFAKMAVRKQGIPFELSLRIPNRETIEAIEESERLLNDPNAKTYSTINEMMADLNA